MCTSMKWSKWRQASPALVVLWEPISDHFPSATDFTLGFLVIPWGTYCAAETYRSGVILPLVLWFNHSTGLDICSFFLVVLWLWGGPSPSLTSFVFSSVHLPASLTGSEEITCLILLISSPLTPILFKPSPETLKKPIYAKRVSLSHPLLQYVIYTMCTATYTLGYDYLCMLDMLEGNYLLGCFSFFSKHCVCCSSITIGMWCWFFSQTNF